MKFDIVENTNLELFRMEGLKKMGAITTIANLLKKNCCAADLQKSIFDKLESKGGFQKADFDSERPVGRQC